MSRITLAFVFALVASLCAAGQQPDFRWLKSTADSVALKQIEQAFSSELVPDDSQSHKLPMTVKFIERVGLQDGSALVVIGEKENKSDPYTVFRAFNYDLKTKAKSPVRSKDVEWLWMWQVEKVAHLTSQPKPTLFSTFLIAQNAKRNNFWLHSSMRQARGNGTCCAGASRTVLHC